MEIHKLTFLFSLLYFCFSGCSNDNDIEEKTNHMEAYTPFVKKSTTSIDLLGYGYDITGAYANVRSVKESVVDMEKLEQNKPGTIYPGIFDTHYSNSFVAHSNWEYTNQITNYSNDNLTHFPSDIAAFSGTIIDNTQIYPGKDKVSDYLYGSAHIFFIKRMSAAAMSATDARSYLTESFKDDLVDLPARELIEKYGTHILCKCYFGARLDFIYRSEVNKDLERRAEILEAGLRDAVVYKVGLWLNGSLDRPEEKDIKENKVPILFIENHGGDNSLIASGTYNLQKGFPNLKFEEWQKSINETNETIITLNISNLIPLEDVITDTEKKAKVKTAIKEYMKERQMPYI